MHLVTVCANQSFRDLDVNSADLDSIPTPTVKVHTRTQARTERNLQRTWYFMHLFLLIPMHCNEKRNSNIPVECPHVDWRDTHMLTVNSTHLLMKCSIALLSLMTVKVSLTIWMNEYRALDSTAQGSSVFPEHMSQHSDTVHEKCDNTTWIISLFGPLSEWSN